MGNLNDVKCPTPQGGNIILVIGGAGSVGSIAIKLLRALTNLTVIATTSRQVSNWSRLSGLNYCQR
jgi:NADPH:quinone reductase